MLLYYLICIDVWNMICCVLFDYENILIIVVDNWLKVLNLFWICWDLEILYNLLFMSIYFVYKC